MANKKIKNAKKILYDGILFDSKLEVDVYKLLRDSKLPFAHESESITLLKEFCYTVPFYKKERKQGEKTKRWKLGSGRYRPWTYTPDFVINTSGWKFYIEAKGYPNDEWRNKRKMFISTIRNNPNTAFFEVHSAKEMKECLDIIKHDYEDKIIENYEESI